jgi:Tol biopolymer transport system component
VLGAAALALPAVAAPGDVQRVSVSSAGAEAGASSGDPSLSGDGRIVAFDTIADDLVPGDGNGVSDVFVRDVVAGTTTRVSTTSGGAEGDGHAGDPAVSENGRVVAFASLATDLVPGDANGDQDVFVKDLATGATTRVSTDAAGARATATRCAPPSRPTDGSSPSARGPRTWSPATPTVSTTSS